MRKLFVWMASAVLIAALCSACSPAQKDLVTIDGQALSRAEIDFCLSTTIEQYVVLTGKSIDWKGTIEGKPAEQYFRDQALELALSAHVTESRAAALGITLSREETDEIDSRIAEEAEAAGGRDAFERQMKERYGGEEIYRYYYYTIPYLNQAVWDRLFTSDGPNAPTQEKLEKFYAENYRCVSFLFITATDGEGMALTGAARDTQRAVAQALWRQADGGADFETLIREHGQDWAMNQTPEGYPIAVGVMGDSFDGAMLSLAVGELSGVVEEPGGFYILLRKPDDPLWLEENYEGVMYYYLSEAYTGLVAEWRAEAKVETSDAYNALDVKGYAPVG